MTVTVKVQSRAGIAGRGRRLGDGDIGPAVVAGDVEPRRFELGAVAETEIAVGEERAGVEHDLDGAGLAGIEARRAEGRTTGPASASASMSNRVRRG